MLFYVIVSYVHCYYNYHVYYRYIIFGKYVYKYDDRAMSNLRGTMKI